MPNGYCSSHEFKVEESHTSATCRYPGDGQNKLVARLDTRGGNKWNKEWIKGDPTKWGGAVLDNGIVNTNENYINYIKSNPKVVQTVDELSVTDTGTTGHYLTLEFPRYNKQLAIVLLPIRITNREIITSAHTALLSKNTYQLKHGKQIFFQVSTRPCCQLENFAIMDARPYLMTRQYSFSIKGVGN